MCLLTLYGYSLSNLVNEIRYHDQNIYISSNESSDSIDSPIIKLITSNEW